MARFMSAFVNPATFLRLPQHLSHENSPQAQLPLTYSS